MNPETKMIRRYERKVYDSCCCDPEYGCECGSTTYDIFYIDRTTGNEVFRYDGADPANTNPSYGGKTDDQHFESLNLDINEWVEVDKCDPRCRYGIIVTAGELIERIKRQKAKEERLAKLEENSKDLHEVFPDLDCSEHSGYCSTSGPKDYSDWEKEVAEPALVAAGYSINYWSTTDGDSFGPLVRRVSVTKDDEEQWLYYG